MDSANRTRADKAAELSEALLTARQIARQEHPHSEHLELHVCGSGHVGTKDCWCEPEIFYKDPDTGTEVYQHREKQ